MRTYCVAEGIKLHAQQWPESEVQKGGDIYVYVWLIHFTNMVDASKYCKEIILQ